MILSVAPLVGAWIETKTPLLRALTTECRTPRGCVDWNLQGLNTCVCFGLSHPSWVRGLKQPWRGGFAWIFHVAPLVGAWIETHIHLSSLYDNMILPLLYICFLKGTIVLFAGHICAISRHFYSISFLKMDYANTLHLVVIFRFRLMYRNKTHASIKSKYNFGTL